MNAAVPLRVMVVDDSPVFRRAAVGALAGVPGLEVVASAPNGRIALMKISASAPDVCVVDLEMPEMTGEELLARLRTEYPRTRVIVLTAHGDRGASRAVQALVAGAADLVLKPVAAGGLAGEALLREVLVPRLLQFRAPAPRPPAACPMPSVAGWRPRALVLGVSTGGPEALMKLVPALGADFPLPVLVVQHMPPGFTRSLAERLDRVAGLAVREAAGGERLAPGTVWIAPGGQHLGVEVGEDGHGYTALSDAPSENSCRPAVDWLFRSAAMAYGGQVLAAVLTGMGADGAAGARALKAAGARVVVQDKATSVVWGMPGAVVALGAADEVVPLDGLAGRLVALAARGKQWNLG